MFHHTGILHFPVLQILPVLLLLQFVFDTVADTLKDNGTVDVFGFGKFSISERAARTGINPATKEKIEIAASKSVKFKASKALKDAVK